MVMVMMVNIIIVIMLIMKTMTMTILMMMIWWPMFVYPPPCRDRAPRCCPTTPAPSSTATAHADRQMPLTSAGSSCSPTLQTHGSRIAPTAATAAQRSSTAVSGVTPLNSHKPLRPQRRAPQVRNRQAWTGNTSSRHFGGELTRSNQKNCPSGQNKNNFRIKPGFGPSTHPPLPWSLLWP